METLLQKAMVEFTYAIKTDQCPWCGSSLYVDGIPCPKCTKCSFDTAQLIVVCSMLLTGEVIEQ